MKRENKLPIKPIPENYGLDNVSYYQDCKDYDNIIPPTKTIKSISEAFSQQPNTIGVGDGYGERVVERIIFEADGECQRVVGYDEGGGVLFSYISASVNIHYF